MKKKLSFFFLIIIAVFFLHGKTKKETSNLPPSYKKWLEEEVVYIITPIEKEVFLKLKTDRERNSFQEAFWKHRDTNPATSENEFKQEHYRRINYVNHFLGRSTPKVGWRTDRGRIYIILGEPGDIQRYSGEAEVYNTEIWFYQGKTNIGLPPGFNLVFFQKGGIGEYELYSPLSDGPQALIAAYWGDATDYLGAYRRLLEIDSNLANVSMSLIPGEGGDGMRPSLSSDILLQKVETAAIRQVKERYAQKFLEYKDRVEVEYTANYIDNDSLVKVIKDPSGVFFVHYAIELERLSVNMYEDRYYTTLKINGTVSNLEGETIYQFEKNVSIDFDKEKMKSVSRQPLSIRDMFPLIPGNYKLSILVKNEVSKEFTSLERNLNIPQYEEALQMTSLILGYKMKKSETQQNRLKPFQMASYQIYFQANRVFLPQDTMVAVFQIYGITQALREKGELRFTFFKSGEQFRTTTKKITEYTGLPNILEEFSLQEFPPAHYSIQASLFFEGREILFESEDFDITPLGAIARPWIYSKILPGREDPIYSYLIGTQLFKSGKITEARARLEKAFQKKPDSIDFALNLSKIYMTLAEYKKVESVLFPFLNQAEPTRYEVYFIMGKVYQNTGELSKAIDVFDKAISSYGLNVNLLNSIGECYFQLGSAEEALVVWEKSLEMNPNQPLIKKNVEALMERK